MSCLALSLQYKVAAADAAVSRVFILCFLCMYRHSKVPDSGLWVQTRYEISDSIRFCIAVVVPALAEAL